MWPRPNVTRGTGAERVGKEFRVAVVGGGLAGISAATVLSERGAEVVVYERESYLGGRAAGWSDELPSGESFQMERGFHAFFRQYYNLRALLRRVDPSLDLLVPLEDYPILSSGGQTESFAGLSRKPPFNVIDLTRRTETITLRDLVQVGMRPALAMLAFDPVTTYRRYDNMTAADYLDSLKFPPRARRMLFDVFAHSFFNPEHDMSAAELLMMFHFYFMGNPEGLVFDVARQPFSTAIWYPIEGYLADRGVTFEMETLIHSVTPADDRFAVECRGGLVDTFDAVVLAVTVPGVKSIVAASPMLGTPQWREAIASLGVTNPFAVWRLWLDRPTRQGRAAFAGTTAMGALDNISLFHLFEDESKQWAESTGGSVVELHAYALADGYEEAALRAELLAGLHELYPETAEANILEERFLIRGDCPAFRPGSHSTRPQVDTGTKGLAVAGDFVRLPMPSALMERAVTSGMMAANLVLAPLGVRPEPICSIPNRGMLARLGALI